MKPSLLGVLLFILLVPFANAQTDELALYYRPSSGNLTLKNVSGHPLSLQTVSILTLGKGNADLVGGYGPIMPSGIPGVNPGEGALSGEIAKLPVTQFQTSNYSSFGLNGIYSEILMLNMDVPFVSLPTNGILDLGNAAKPGWTQAILNQIFITNPDISPNDGLNYGFFLYQSTGGFTLAPVLVDLTSEIQNSGVNSTQIVYQKSSNSILVRSESSNPTKYQIYSFSGQIVASGIIEGQTIDVGQLGIGPYLVKIEQNGNLFTQKIVKN